MSYAIIFWSVILLAIVLSLKLIMDCILFILSAAIDVISKIIQSELLIGGCAIVLIGIYLILEGGFDSFFKTILIIGVALFVLFIFFAIAGQALLLIIGILCMVSVKLIEIIIKIIRFLNSFLDDISTSLLGTIIKHSKQVV